MTLTAAFLLRKTDERRNLYDKQTCVKGTTAPLLSDRSNNRLNVCAVRVPGGSIACAARSGKQYLDHVLEHYEGHLHATARHLDYRRSHRRRSRAPCPIDFEKPTRSGRGDKLAQTDRSHMAYSQHLRLHHRVHPAFDPRRSVHPVNTRILFLAKTRNFGITAGGLNLPVFPYMFRNF